MSMTLKEIFPGGEAKAEQILHDYISGKEKTDLKPSEEADGSIDLHGPGGELLCKCYDAVSAVLIIRAFEAAKCHALTMITQAALGDVLTDVLKAMKKGEPAKGAAEKPKSGPIGDVFASFMRKMKGENDGKPS